MNVSRTVVVSLVLMAPTVIAHPQPRRAHPSEALLDRLEGRWTMTGTVRGKSVTYTLDARRVLQGRFLDLHMVDVSAPPQYEARVSLGVDPESGELIAHWLDSFGARYSVPHGTGGVTGESITFTVPYPDGAFRDTFTYAPGSDRWRFLIEASDNAGAWTTFARYDVIRTGAR